MEPDTLKGEWVNRCLFLARRPADLWSHSTQKILRNRRITFEHWDDSLQLDDAGYDDEGRKKLGDLTRLYLDEESRAAAVGLWNERRGRAKYGSVAFTTCNHLTKPASLASEQGPCMLSVTVTWLAKNQAAIDVSYRSSEIFKKLAGDLVFLRDVLLTPFDFAGMDVTVTCHFANMTVHPSYWAIVLAHVDDPVAAMEELRKDPAFHKWCVRRTGEYICPEMGASIANHSQSQRVKTHALRVFTGPRLRALQRYVREFSAHQIS